MKLTENNVYKITRKGPRNFLVEFRTNEEQPRKKAQTAYVDIQTQHDVKDAKELSQEMRRGFKIRDYGNGWKWNAPISPSFMHAL